MAYREIIELQYKEIMNLQDTLTKLTNSYRILIGAANELNGIALAKKGQIKDALKRAEEVGRLIDDVTDALNKCQCRYLDYCVLYSECMKYKINVESINCEIDNICCCEPPHK